MSDRSALLDEGTWVTDGGLETDLLFHHGVDLPEFASFPLVEDADGAALLTSYYREYAAIADQAGAGLLLETPTWRANSDWAALVGYDADALRRVNAAAVDLVRGVAGDRSRISGVVGPRGDGYLAGTADADEARSTTTARSRPSPRPVSTSCTR